MSILIVHVQLSKTELIDASLCGEMSGSQLRILSE